MAYVLGITRVDPIRHNLLFERFINEGRTTYPDVDIDFSSERREEVIQYVYDKYGPEHTGMVCNVVTYRARSVVREVGVALGFPRPLVDRVAKALETYDSVMVRRDLEADGGFAEFFRRSSDPVQPVAEAHGLADRMGRLNLPGKPAIVPGKPAIRPGGSIDDKGGPGDSPASVAWLQAGTWYRHGRWPGDRPRERCPPAPGTADRQARPAESLGRWQPGPGRAPTPAARSASRTGSAGSSSAPGWTASRATSASTAAGC